MNARTLVFSGLIALATTAGANIVVTDWIPIFKGIDRAVGTNYADSAIPRLQVVNCVRIDLQEPTLQLVSSRRAPNYSPPGIETLSLSVSNFLKQQNLQIATVANFYNPSDPSSEGTSISVEGLLVTTGQVVSAYDSSRYSSLLFTSNKTVTISLLNSPPNLAGIHTAVSGFYPVLIDDEYPGDSYLSTTYPDQTIHQAQPRTIHGLSANRRYLYFMVIDGRQNGYSVGATDYDSALWSLQFGMSDAINMDGGGSAAMYMADCSGNPVALGHSSLIASRNRERYTGAHIGISAEPLPSFITEIATTAGSATAVITWKTESNSTSQVQYGLTPSFGATTPLDSTMVTNHTVLLGGLSAGARYYFRVLSVAGGTQYSSSCGTSSFSTTNIGVSLAFSLTNNWKFDFNNYDGVNWQAPNFDDSGWQSGPAPMWADSRVPGTAPTNTLIPNIFYGTRMPINGGSGYPYSTYYLRTRFVHSGSPSGITLSLSNFIDDGAVFYLNGVEIYRTNMPAGFISNGTYTPAGALCGDGNATCPLVFSFNGQSGNLVTGTNVMAVEVHNFRSLSSGIPSPDVTFEAALFSTLPPPPPQIITNIVVAPGETSATIAWTTTTNSTTQVQYGTTPALGSSNTLDAAFVTSHSVTLAGLLPLTTYYFRVLSSAGGDVFSQDGSFATVPFLVPVVTESNVWKFTTNNLNGVNWTAKNYNDSGWLGQGPPLLYIEDNVGVSPRSTSLPGALPGGAPMPTYYFRTHFTFSNSLAGLALVFTNYIDDGAVFYLNGVEVQRVRMASAPQSVSYTTLAVDCPVNSCEATLDVPDVFRLSGNTLTNVAVGGDNVLAAEVHQLLSPDTDIVFGSAMGLVRATASETALKISRAGNGVCLSWTGALLKLQQAANLNGTNAWADVSGSVTSSPYCTTNMPSTTFYRLRD